MRLTKATLKRLIKEELDAMREPSEDAFAVAQQLMSNLERDGVETFEQAAEYVRTTLLPTLEMMASDPERYKERGMI
jgi:hypothetical protein